MNIAEAALEALDATMRDSGPNSVTDDEAAALAYGLLGRAITLLMGKAATPEITHRIVGETLDSLLELRGELLLHRARR